MKITALAPWFGSKRTLAPKIVAELGKHRAYWEPFCGSMSVLLAKPPASMETVNDLHGDLINLARVVQHPQAGPKLYRRLRRVMLSRSAHQDAAEHIRVGGPSGLLDEDRAFHYFIASWFGRNGVAGTSSYNAGFCARYTKNGGHAAKRFTSAVDSIPAWRRRMRNVSVMSDDGFAMLARIEDAAGVVIYVDPPYLVKGANYVHDFDDFAPDPRDPEKRIDKHELLALHLRRFRKTRVVVSYYDHPRLAELYPGWTKRCFDVSKAMAHQGSRGSNDTRATEVLLINGPSYVERAEPDRPAGDVDLFSEVTQ